MIACLQCGKETTNPKFCSQSCSATYNNKKYPKRGKGKKKFCKSCGKELIGAKRKNIYCGHACEKEYQTKIYIKNWLEGKITGTVKSGASRFIKHYLLKKSNYRCELCGWGETNLTTGKVPLEIDHIDGNYKNNQPENLRVICPNCHSLTSNYKALNTGTGRKYRYYKN